MLLGNGAK